MWSDGWLEQGGIIAITEWQCPTINLLKSYSDTNYIVATHGISYHGSTYHATGCMWSKAKNSFSHYFYNNIGVNPSWYTCGY